MKPTRDFAILFVDDERGNRVVFEQAFGDRFRIICADSAAAALALLEREPVGVVVTDQRMPGLSGNDLLIAVKAQYPDVIRVVITAFSDLEPIMRAVNEGLVARYIIKPWEADELAEILAWAIEAYDLGRNNAALQHRLMRNEQLAALGTLSAALFHDLQQPVSYLTYNTDQLSEHLPVIAGLGSLLERFPEAMPAEESARLRDFFEEIPEIVEELKGGCMVLLDLSQTARRLLDPRGVSTTPQECAPRQVVEFAIAVCRQPVIDARAKVKLECDDDLPRVQIGEARLVHTLVNLITNAAQALKREGMRNRGIIVTARTAPEAENPGVWFAVNDNGPGMDREILAQVDRPFFSTHQHGTGLGLMQCRRFVEGAGGRLAIESQPGRGTIIRFHVPAAFAVETETRE